MIAGIVALTLGATLLVVSPHAEAAFDAPKRLVAAIGLVAAAAAWLLRAGSLAPLTSPTQRLAAAALGAGAGASLLSAALSPSPGIAWDTLRWGALLSLAVLLGATRDLEAGRMALPGAVLVFGTSLNALFALAALAGFQTFLLVPTPHAAGLLAGAFLGNEGLLGLLIALAAPVTLAFAGWGPTRSVRSAALAVLLLLFGTLVSIRSLTGVVALVAGLVPVAAAEPRLRKPAFAAIPAVLVLALAAPAVRSRLSVVAASVRSGDVAAVVSWRTGAWGAAAEMVRARPLTGFGPGTYGGEFFVKRLSAEARLGRRLTYPTARARHEEAHGDLLQAAAELGLPAAFAFLVATIAVGARLVLRVPGNPEAAAVLGVLIVGAVASLLWFPLHRPALALPLLLALGRGLVLETGEKRH